MLKRSVRVHRGEGFTLVELLIVIAIIGVLAGLALRSIQAVRESTDEAITKTTISSLQNALDAYLQDEGTFPGQGQKIDADVNQFPHLFNALFGERKPHGPGGRNAPYMKMKEDDVYVRDDDRGELRKAKRSEIHDPEIDKYLVDQWREELIYRCNKGRKRKDWMHNPYGADIYSNGPDSKDQTKEGSDDENDDIGNW